MTRRAGATLAGWLAGGIRFVRTWLGGGARAVEGRLDRIRYEDEADRLRGLTDVYSFDAKLSPETEAFVDEVLSPVRARRA